MKIQVFRDVIFARSTAPPFSQSSSPRILLDPEDVGTIQTHVNWKMNMYTNIFTTKIIHSK